MWQVSPSISAAPPDSSSPAASSGGSASQQPAPGSTATDISVHTVHKITRTVLESLAKECRDAHDNPPADGKVKHIRLDPAVTLAIAAIGRTLGASKTIRHSQSASGRNKNAADTVGGEVPTVRACTCVREKLMRY